jgi:hypothetical protein
MRQHNTLRAQKYMGKKRVTGERTQADSVYEEPKTVGTGWVGGLCGRQKPHFVSWGVRHARCNLGRDTDLWSTAP